MMFKILDKELLKLWIIPTIISFIICLFLFFIGDLLGLTDHFFEHTPSFSTVLIYYIYRMSHISYFLATMALMLGGFWGLSGWRKTNQWTATLSSGRHPIFILRTPLLVLSILTLILLYYTIYFLPGISNKANFMRDVKIKGGKMKKPSYRNLHFQLPEGGAIKIGKFKPEAEEIQDISINFQENGKIFERWEASRGHYQPATGWKLLEPTIRKFNSAGEHTTSKKEKIIFAFEPPGLVKEIINSDPRRIDKKPEQFTLRELEQAMNFRRRRGMNIDAERVYWHWKFSFPLSGLILGIVGILLGLQDNISRPAGIGYCLIASFAYWVIFNSFLSFGQSGSLRFLAGAFTPILFTYGPLMLYSALICYLWKRAL